MKKLIALLLALMLALALAVPASAAGEDIGIIGGADGPTYILVSADPKAAATVSKEQREQNIKALGGVAGQVNVLLGDRCIAFTDAVPEVKNGRTMVPLRAALEAMGITADTPDPEGGRIGREADGRTPNGYLEETAFLRIRAALPAPSRADACKALAAAEQAYLSHGIVLAQEGLADQGRYDLLASARLTVDTVGYADLKHDPDLAERPGIGGYKIFLDG